MNIYRILARETIAVDATAGGKALTTAKITNNTVYALLQVQAAQIRFTEDGTAPVAETTGMIGYVGDLLEVWGTDALKALRMIRETSTSANIEVWYYGVG